MPKAAMPSGDKIRCPKCNEAVVAGNQCRCGMVDRRRYRDNMQGPNGQRRAKK